MGDWRCQFNVSHPLTANLGTGDFDAALVADRPRVANSLELAAIALPVLGRTEDALAEQAAMLRLERSIVDGLRLRYFAVRPGTNRLWRCQADSNCVKIIHIKDSPAVLPV